MQTVILAGGLGTRLRPLTYDIPKPMVPVNGKPYLEYQIEYLKKFGLTNILILISYLGEKIIEHFGDGSKFGVTIQYSREETPLGTGGALKLAENLLEDEFLIIYGDSFLPVDYTDLLNFYRQHNVSSLLVAYLNDFNKTSVPSNVAVGKDFLVQKYEKDSSDPDLHYVDSGVLISKKNLVSMIPAHQKYSLEEMIFSKLIEKKELIAYVTKDRFYDIGTPERLAMITHYFSSDGNF